MHETTTKQKKLILFPVLFLLGIFTTFAQPNFVVIIMDDQGWTGSSVQMDNNLPGSKSDFYYTPQMELLAQQGMTFSQAYAPAPKCSPTRCSILTGRSTARNHFTNTGNDIATDKILIEALTNTSLDGTDTTLVEWLKSAGLNYRTAHYGKWHLGNANTSSPSNNGFDFNDGSTNNNDGNNGGTVQPDPKKIFELTDRSIDFIQDAVTDGVPFFLQLSHYAVHEQTEARQETIDLYNDASQRPPGSNHTNVEYGAMTEDTDTGIGELLAEISNLGLDDNTYVIVTSDNGGQINVTNNTPLLRGKTFIYEGGIRVPFIIRGPNVPVDVYFDQPIALYDLFPTVAELTGSSVALPSNLDGQSLAPIFTAGTFNRAIPLFFHSPHYENNPNKSPRSAIVDGDHKLIVEYETGNFYLYDLAMDIGESNDLSASQGPLVEELCIQLRDHLKEANATMPTLDPSHPNFSGVAPDIDADGLEDSWEFRELLSYTYGPDDDPDGDGMNNLEEYNAGTDPYKDETVLALQEPASLEVGITANALVRLSWRNQKSWEADFIEIDRSADGVEWNRIGKVNSKTSSFLDNDPLEGLAYYRLKVVSSRGSIDYSSIVSIVLNRKEIMQIFPNPVAETLHVQFKDLNLLPKEFQLQIFADNGQLIKEFQEKRRSLISLPVEELEAGVYFLQLHLGLNYLETPAVSFLVD